MSAAPSHDFREDILDEAYEEARDLGHLRWIAATRSDPGCWSDEVDLQLTPGESDVGFLRVRALAKVGRNVVFFREYEIDPADGMLCGWEDI